MRFLLGIYRFVKKRPRRGAVFFALLFALAFLVESTFSWFSVGDFRLNALSVPQRSFHASAIDEFVPPSASLKPGGVSVDKKLSTVNDGELATVVRVLVIPTIIAKDGETLLPAHFGKEVIADLNITNWKDGEDGYYYYLGILFPGEISSKLFTNIGLARDLDDRYKGARLVIEVKLEASVADIEAYRMGWWGSKNPPQVPALSFVDGVLSAIV